MLPIPVGIEAIGPEAFLTSATSRMNYDSFSSPNHLLLCI